jgi:hypothetical protein
MSNLPGLLRNATPLGKQIFHGNVKKTSILKQRLLTLKKVFVFGKVYGCFL